MYIKNYFINIITQFTKKYQRAKCAKCSKCSKYENL